MRRLRPIDVPLGLTGPVARANLSTTTLGAVNTGAIVSGVKAAVGGVVGQY